MLPEFPLVVCPEASRSKQMGEESLPAILRPLHTVLAWSSIIGVLHFTDAWRSISKAGEWRLLSHSTAPRQLCNGILQICRLRLLSARCLLSPPDGAAGPFRAGEGGGRASGNPVSPVASKESLSGES